jgi:hypothetical protein
MGLSTNPKVNKETIKTLVTLHGQREAARLSGLSENTVKSWSLRYGWNKAKPTQLVAHPISTQSPSDALRSTLTERSNKTKLALSQAVLRASEHLATSEPAAIIKQARAMKDVAGTGSVVLGWEQSGRDVGPFNPQAINILSQRTYLNVGNPELQGE